MWYGFAKSGKKCVSGFVLQNILKPLVVIRPCTLEFWNCLLMCVDDTLCPEYGLIYLQMTAYADLELTSRSLSFVNQTGFLVVTQVVTETYLVVLMEGKSYRFYSRYYVCLLCFHKPALCEYIKIHKGSRTKDY